MQVSRNERLIKSRARVGTYATFGGLGVLVAGMVATFYQQYVWLSFIALLVGFLLSQVGSYHLRRWGRTPRPDQVLENALKGFDDRYHFYAWMLPAPYVLISPQGVYSFVTRDQTGPVTVEGWQARTKMSVGKVLTAFAQEGIGQPVREAVEQAEQLTKWIKAKLPDTQFTVQPVVVFIDERVQLQVNEPAVPTMEAKGLKKWLRGGGKGESLKGSDLKALEALFDGRASP